MEDVDPDLILVQLVQGVGDRPKRAGDVGLEDDPELLRLTRLDLAVEVLQRRSTAAISATSRNVGLAGLDLGPGFLLVGHDAENVAGFRHGRQAEDYHGARWLGLSDAFALVVLEGPDLAEGLAHDDDIADAEGVDVRLYDIIYKLTDDISAALQGLLEPEIVEVVEGRAEVRQIFRVGKSTVIAGCFVTDGRIVRGGARVWRNGKIVVTDKIESLRRFRDDVREVAQNYECGIGLAGYNDLEEGDIIECFTSQSVSRVLPS